MSVGSTCMKSDLSACTRLYLDLIYTSFILCSMKTPAPTRSATIRAWGNGHGVLLPKQIVDALSLADAEVHVSVRGTSSVVLSKAPRSTKKLTLVDMIRGVAHPRHERVDFGAPQGREIW